MWEGYDDEAQIRAIVPYSALEAFEATTRPCSTASPAGGEVISGFGDLPSGAARFRSSPLHALVDFYDDVFREQPVRWQCYCCKPVARCHEGRGMAAIRGRRWRCVKPLALQILEDPDARPWLVTGGIAFTVLWGGATPRRATPEACNCGPVARGDLSPIAAPPTAPREL